MAVYIDIDALIDAQLYDDEHEEWNWQRMSVRDYLFLACDVLPTAADVRPVVRGEWTHEHLVSTAGWCYEVIRCSECGWDYPMLETNYCPHCGADMRGDTDGVEL